MRERAAASGGSIEIGPRERGGFRVRVAVPLEPTLATAAR
jgi:signal transduction histidine kinase